MQVGSTVHLEVVSLNLTGKRKKRESYLQFQAKSVGIYQSVGYEKVKINIKTK